MPLAILPDKDLFSVQIIRIFIVYFPIISSLTLSGIFSRRRRRASESTIVQCPQPLQWRAGTEQLTAGATQTGSCLNIDPGVESIKYQNENGKITSENQRFVC